MFDVALDTHFIQRIATNQQTRIIFQNRLLIVISSNQWELEKIKQGVDSKVGTLNGVELCGGKNVHKTVSEFWKENNLRLNYYIPFQKLQMCPLRHSDIRWGRDVAPENVN